MLTKSTFYLLYEGAGDPPCADFGAVYYPEDPVQSQFALWTWTNYRNPVEVIEDMGENRIETIEGSRCNAKELLEAMKTLGPVQALTVPDFDYTFEWGPWDRGPRVHMCVWDQGSFYSLDFYNNKDNPSDHIRVPKEEFTRFMRGVERMLVADIYPVGQQRHQKLNHFTAQSAPPNPSDVQNIPCSIEYGKEYANPDTGISYSLDVNLNPGTHICSLKIVKQKDGKPIDCPEKPPVLTCGIQQFLSGLNCGDKISALETLIGCWKEPGIGFVCKPMLRVEWLTSWSGIRARPLVWHCCAVRNWPFFWTTRTTCSNMRRIADRGNSPLRTVLQLLPALCALSPPAAIAACPVILTGQGRRQCALRQMLALGP